MPSLLPRLFALCIIAQVDQLIFAVVTVDNLLPQLSIMPLTSRSSRSSSLKRPQHGRAASLGCPPSGRCRPRASSQSGTPSPKKKREASDPTPSKVDKKGICQGKSMTAKVDKITADHNADRQAQEECAREESFEALTGDVSKGDRNQRDKLFQTPDGKSQRPQPKVHCRRLGQSVQQQIQDPANKDVQTLVQCCW